DAQQNLGQVPRRTGRVGTSRAVSCSHPQSDPVEGGCDEGRDGRIPGNYRPGHLPQAPATEGLVVRSGDTRVPVVAGCADSRSGPRPLPGLAGGGTPRVEPETTGEVAGKGGDRSVWPWAGRVPVPAPGWHERERRPAPHLHDFGGWHSRGTADS